MINWNLLDSPNLPNVGEAVRAGYEQQRRRSALGALARDSSDQNAVSALMEVDPALAMSIREGQRREAGHDRETIFRKAAGQYLQAGSRNALQGFAAGVQPTQTSVLGGPVAGSEPQPDSVVPVGHSTRANPASPMGPRELSSPSAGEAPGAVPNNRAFTGEGASRDEMLNLMYQSNPQLALRLERDDQEAQYEFAEQYRDVNRWAIEMLGGVADQASWDRMLQQADSMYRRLGINVRELVPEEYPGPDSVRQLLMGAMDADQQLAAQDRRHNIDADNERADMNTESMIENRDARTGIARDGLDVRRRGQDIVSGDRRRGQDIVSRDRRRGQDRTGGRRNGGRQTGNSRPLTATGPNGQRLRLNPRTNRWEAAN